MRTRLALRLTRDFVAAWLVAACTREQPRPAADSTATVAAVPAVRACLARDTVLEYSNERGGEEGDDPSGEPLILRRVGGRWSGIARSFYTPDDSVIDSLIIVPATGAISFRLWPHTQGPTDFRGTIDCDSITGASRYRGTAPPIADVYRNVRLLQRPTPTLVALDPSLVIDTTVSDTGLRLDARGRPRLPITYANGCEGEDCLTSFRAVVCAQAVLRQRPSIGAPFVASVQEGDTIHVDRVDFHVVSPGIVVIKRPVVLDRYHGIADDKVHARTDTLRFAAGDTVYLTRYGELGWWSYVWRGQERSSESFWGTPPDSEALAMGVVSSDTSRAAARSQPTREYWWLVSQAGEVRGWWLRDTTHALRSIDAHDPDPPCSFHYER